LHPVLLCAVKWPGRVLKINDATPAAPAAPAGAGAAAATAVATATAWLKVLQHRVFAPDDSGRR